jgi:tetratricopeptide (TPR) repeat protein
VGNYPECKRACSMALAFDAKNEKAIFRRGQAQLASRNFKEAIEDFETVLEINPANEAAKQQIEQCHQEIKAYQVKEKELYHSFLTRKKTNKVRYRHLMFKKNKRTRLFFSSSRLMKSTQHRQNLHDF